MHRFLFFLRYVIIWNIAIVGFMWLGALYHCSGALNGCSGASDGYGDAFYGEV